MAERFRQKGIIAQGIRNVVYWVGEKHYNRGLDRDGKLHFQPAVVAIRDRGRYQFSELYPALNSFEIIPSGLESVRGLDTFVYVTNHSSEGPLRGFWHLVVANYLVKEITGKEMRWVAGQGSKLVSKVHRDVAYTFNGIPATGRDGVLEILNGALNGEIIAFHPEGRPSHSLVRGKENAGKLLNLIARRNIPIVCAASWNEGDMLFVNVGKPLEAWALDLVRNGQTTVDYVMYKIASLFPDNQAHLRGVYR